MIDIAKAVPGGPSVRFELASAARARVVIHGIDGRVVRSLADGWRAAGPHAVTWDGRDDRGQGVAPGVYFVRLEAGSRTDHGRVIVIR